MTCSNLSPVLTEAYPHFASESKFSVGHPQTNNFLLRNNLSSESRDKLSNSGFEQLSLFREGTEHYILPLLPDYATHTTVTRLFPAHDRSPREPAWDSRNPVDRDAARSYRPCDSKIFQVFCATRSHLPRARASALGPAAGPGPSAAVRRARI